jgi:hypothetical protein
MLRVRACDTRRTAAVCAPSAASTSYAASAELQPGMAPGTAAQASAGSRVSDGNAHRALPIRTHGAPPQERQIARSVTQARALLAGTSARSHPTCRHHSDTADVTHMSST